MLRVAPESKREIVPVHAGCDVGRGLAVCILRDAGFSIEEYLRLR